MTKQEIIDFANDNPVMQLATVDADGNPRSRRIFMYSADESGIVFHVGSFKPVSRELDGHPVVEVNFFDPKEGIQIRVQGKVSEVAEQAFKEKVASTPGREFLKPIIAKFGYDAFRVFRIRDCHATVWTMQTNMEYPKRETCFG
ncbi:MAG TPA: pyridoxamine 5'-phosphate oxidase family protein [Spirochaetota bacterium]